jgi:hypothetical protein
LSRLFAARPAAYLRADDSTGVTNVGVAGEAGLLTACIGIGRRSNKATSREIAGTGGSPGTGIINLVSFPGFHQECHQFVLCLICENADVILFIIV